jgi:hypothetical protein
MKNSKRIMSVVMLFALGVIMSAQGQRPTRVADRQVSSILQRLEQSSNTFQVSLNRALISGRIDQTRPQNDINSFEPAYQAAVDQFGDRFTHRSAGAADVQNILQKAALVNGFMARNRLNATVQSNWTAVRTELNSLASAYAVSWNWNQALPSINSSRRSRLSDSELNQLIQQIETGSDRFQSSLTDAFGRSRANRTRAEDNINNVVRDFKNATDQLRNQFDASKPHRSTLSCTIISSPTGRRAIGRLCMAI